MRGKPPKKGAGKHKHRDQPTPKPQISKWKWDWKYWLALVLSLLIGALGLRAIPTVSLETPLNPDDVLSTPIVISNDGLLALTNVNVATYVVQEQWGLNAAAHDTFGAGYYPPNQRLEPGEAETVPFRTLVSAGEGVSKLTCADVALIVSFQVEYIPFIRRIRPFRFKTMGQKDGTLRFQKQPPGDVANRFQTQVKKASELYKKFPHNPRNPPSTQ
jgi:hypothetical protein